MSDPNTRETRQTHSDRIYTHVSIKDQNYWTCSFEIEANGLTASIVGNCSHGQQTLASGNKIEIFVDSELAASVPMTKWLWQGFMPPGLLTAMLAEVEWHVKHGLENGWYRPRQTTARGGEDQ